MGVRNLSFFVFIICSSIVGTAAAHTLHVGDKVFTLSQTQYTTPALACKINNKTWYAPLTAEELTNTLHVRLNNITYSATQPDGYAAIIAQNCPEIFTDTTNYTYDNDGRLIGADGDLYLQSTGTQYINTDFTPSLNSYMKIDFYHTQSARSHIGAVSQYTDDLSMRYTFGITGVSTVNTTAFIVYNGYNRTGDYWRIEKNAITGKGTGRYLLTLDKRNATIAGLTHTFPNTQYSMINKLFLFAFNNTTGLSIQNSTKIYSCILKDNDVLARHLVPVPACMRIGNFIVPENGMWDIVEQRFYGNSGTGSFIYGKDE